MIHKRFVVPFFVLSFVLFATFFVSAQTSFIDRINTLDEVFQNPDLFNLQTSGLKLVFLAVMVVIILAGLIEADFPKPMPLKFILAALIGYLATALITAEEITAAMLSYKAFGIAVLLFVPIMGLGFVTYVSVKRGKGVFILAQRLLWLAYAMFLILYVIGLVVLRWDVGFNYNNADFTAGINDYNSKVASVREAESRLALVDPSDATALKTAQDAVALAERGLDSTEEKLPGLINQYRFIFGPDFVRYSKDLKISNTTLLILSVMALFVFWMFVVKNNAVVKYLEQDIRERDIDEETNIIKKSHARDVANADVVGKKS